MTTDSKNPETLALHAGWRSDPTTNSVAVPIHQTTSYQFDSTEMRSRGVQKIQITNHVVDNNADPVLVFKKADAKKQQNK